MLTEATGSSSSYLLLGPSSGVKEGYGYAVPLPEGSPCPETLQQTTMRQASHGHTDSPGNGLEARDAFTMLSLRHTHLEGHGTFPAKISPLRLFLSQTCPFTDKTSEEH